MSLTSSQRGYIKRARQTEAEKRKKDDETKRRYNKWCVQNGRPPLFKVKPNNGG